MNRLMIALCGFLMVIAACKKQNTAPVIVRKNPYVFWHLVQKFNQSKVWNLNRGECDIVLDTVKKYLTVKGPKSFLFLPAGAYSYKFKDTFMYAITLQGLIKDKRKILNTTPRKHGGLMVYNEWSNGLQIVIDQDFGTADDEDYFEFE